MLVLGVILGPEHVLNPETPVNSILTSALRLAPSGGRHRGPQGCEVGWEGQDGGKV